VGADRQSIDVLMITYNRPEYTRLALAHLLDVCDEDMRVWVWHNGTHAPTLDVVQGFRDHPRLHRFHHSAENKKLREPTNWLWSQAQGDLLSKVDDDCLVPPKWAESLRRAHREVGDYGVIGCWRFPDEDFVPELAQRKIRSFPGGHRLMVNPWVEGSGYLMKRACLDAVGTLSEKQSFSDWCIEVAARGWVNGWVYPFLYQEHMDDPRSEHTLLKTDEDLLRYLPLSAQSSGVRTLAEWQDQLRRSARILQQVSTDPRKFRGWRRRIDNVQDRVRKLLARRKRSS
jgi:glycosyltransferase involved in cell wall biosynthesis